MSSAGSKDVSSEVHARLLNHDPRHIVCPSGYIDHTQGRAFYWSCAAGCPGEWAWGDIVCGCACVRPSECISWTAEDPCVTKGEQDNPALVQSLGRVVAATEQPKQYVQVEESIPTKSPLYNFQHAPVSANTHTFLQATTTASPSVKYPLDSWIIVVGVIGGITILACAPILVFLCFQDSLLPRIDERASPKVHPAPEALAGAVAPMPTLLATRVQPEVAWPKGEKKDCSTLVSTQWQPKQSSARSSPRPSTRSSSHTPHLSTRSTACSRENKTSATSSPRPSTRTRSSSRSPLPSTRSASRNNANQLSVSSSPRGSIRSPSRSPRPSEHSCETSTNKKGILRVPISYF